MQVSFQNLQEFIDKNKNCPFCHGKLKFKLTSYHESDNLNIRGFAISKGSLKLTIDPNIISYSDNKFKVSISLENGEITFYSKDIKKNQQNLSKINNLSLFPSLGCKCKNNYDIYCNSLLCLNVDQKYKLSDISLCSQTFSFNQDWIQDIFYTDKTFIFSLLKGKEEDIPIELPLVSWDFSLSEMGNKIKTIKNFS